MSPAAASRAPDGDAIEPAFVVRGDLGCLSHHVLPALPKPWFSVCRLVAVALRAQRLQVHHVVVVAVAVHVVDLLGWAWHRGTQRLQPCGLQHSPRVRGQLGRLRRAPPCAVCGQRAPGLPAGLLRHVVLRARLQHGPLAGRGSAPWALACSPGQHLPQRRAVGMGQRMHLHFRACRSATGRTGVRRLGRRRWRRRTRLPAPAARRSAGVIRLAGTGGKAGHVEGPPTRRAAAGAPERTSSSSGITLALRIGFSLLVVEGRGLRNWASWASSTRT